MYSSIAIVSIIAVAQAVNLEDWANCKANASAMNQERAEHTQHGAAFWWNQAPAEEMMEEVVALDDGIVLAEEEPMRENGWMRARENGLRERDAHSQHGDDFWWGQWEAPAAEMEVALGDEIVAEEEESMRGWMRPRDNVTKEREAHGQHGDAFWW